MSTLRWFDPNPVAPKPFSPRELIARINAVLRRTVGTKDKQLEIDGLTLDSITHRVTAQGHSVNMGPTEFLCGIWHYFRRL